jgi:acetylornithine deacetylase/succinyl-diaminopimelate desuccinylase-like protein
MLPSTEVAAPETVIGSLDDRFDETVDQLCDLARIPGVSAAGFDPREVARSAERTAEILVDTGLDGVEVVTIEGAHPYVLAEKRAPDPAAPTALIYAHHDVQPPGRLDHWHTPAFEPTLRDDGRLYGRGVVDDKAGILLNAAALRAWLDAEGALPMHVKVIVEGEEETGSAHLAEFLRRHRERLDADVLVLSDTQNFATGVPSLTTALRGMVAVDVHVHALDHPVHSGMWGGPIPDAATALATLLARLTDAAGEIAVPGIDADVPALDPEERARLAELPLDIAGFRADVGVLDGVRLRGVDDGSIYERLWYRPSLALIALEAMPLATAANQLIASASARVGVRIAPGQDARRVSELLVEFLQSDPPEGVRVETAVPVAVPGWKTTPVGPAFDAARRALARGFGRESVAVGCGGSIPFVGPFSEVLGGVPALLLGLEDPPCNAHGENESLHLGDFRKAAHASAHLLAELATLPPR